MDERFEQMKEVDIPKRPTLMDPKEYALIKAIHFAPSLPQDLDNLDLDPLERLDRMQHTKNRNNR